jgi:hypothetical protein
VVKNNKKFEQWIHVKVTNREIVERLDLMCDFDERDRSKFIRWLIQQEWARRSLSGHLTNGSSIQESEKVAAS